MSFAKNHLLLASGSDDYTVKLWDVGSGGLLHTFQGHLEWVVTVVFSPNDEFIASGSWDTTVKLWKVSTRSLLTTLHEHSSWVKALGFSPDGSILASRDEGELKLMSLCYNIKL